MCRRARKAHGPAIVWQTDTWSRSDNSDRRFGDGVGSIRPLAVFSDVVVPFCPFPFACLPLTPFPLTSAMLSLRANSLSKPKTALTPRVASDPSRHALNNRYETADRLDARAWA